MQMVAARSTHLDRLFTIAPSRPFLPTLARAIAGGRLVPGLSAADPMTIARTTILVPTRRAARALEVALLDALGTRAMMAPQIRPIGDIDEDAGELARDVAAEDVAAGRADRAMPAYERHLALTRLVMAWRARVAAQLHITGRDGTPLRSTPAEAVHLAGRLMRLMDQVATEGVGWGALAGLVEGDLARYWAMSLDFLQIVTEHWPAFLAERGLEDPASRRDRLIRREAERLAAHPPAGPMIVAGSTGSVPATAALIRAVSRLNQGAVVLPGLDCQTEPAVWATIGDAGTADAALSHPQYGLKLLLDRLDADRIHVQEIEPEPDAALTLRGRIVAAAFRPSIATADWSTLDFGTDTEAALAGVSLIEADTETDEALAVAVALREAIHQGRSAALVTPHRDLARRVASELRRFDLTVDDSAGRPLTGTPAATLARLVVDVALSGWSPADLAGMLLHPMLRLGWAPDDRDRAVRCVDLMALRGPRPAPGIDALRRAVDLAVEARTRAPGRQHPALRRLTDEDVDLGRSLLDRLDVGLSPLLTLAAVGSAPLAGWLAAHRAALAALMAGPADGDATEQIAPDTAALFDVLDDLGLASAGPDGTLDITAEDYPATFLALLAGQSVRPAGGTETRIHILGPLEARLLSFDRLVLGGLVEGLWPATATTDPWLSRPMKADLGLEAPERRIGLAAHDVTQALGSREVILTRAMKMGNAPTVPSRWLLRLQAVIGAPATQALRARAHRFLDLARHLDVAPAVTPLGRPAPRPPVAQRPRGLSVTEIETLIRDPYAIYARHILKLQPLDRIGEMPDASTRGQIVHAVLARFLAEAVTAGDVADLSRFTRICEEELAGIAAFPAMVALWRIRLAAIGRWFVATEPGRSRDIVDRRLEASGRLTLPGVDFTLRGRADRIDVLRDGGLSIIDYKTGAPPTDKQVNSLLSPQLPLEAMMARGGAFAADHAGRPIAELAYVHLKGGTAGGEWCPVRPTAAPSLDDLADAARERLIRLVGHFGHPATTYPSRVRIAMEARRDGDYDHLARVAEWSIAAAEDDE